MDNETQVQIGLGDKAQFATLADLGNIDMTQIESNFGFQTTPAGTYTFRCTSTELKPMEMLPRGETEKITVPAVEFLFQATNCLNLNDKGKNPAEYTDIEHRELFFIRDLKQDLGRCNALMEQAGLQMTGLFTDLLNAFIGTEFKCVITNKADKNDKDRIYANIALKQVSPMETDPMAGSIAPAQPLDTAPVASTAPVAPPVASPATTQPVATDPPLAAPTGFSLNQ